jgi:hypothetical protein
VTYTGWYVVIWDDPNLHEAETVAESFERFKEKLGKSNMCSIIAGMHVNTGKNGPQQTLELMSLWATHFMNRKF